jgi:hypothetical protein
MSGFWIPKGSFVADVSEENGITLTSGIILGKTLFSCRGVSREEPDVAEFGCEYSLNQLTGSVHPDQARETLLGHILNGKIRYEKRTANGARVFATLTHEVWKAPEWFKGKITDEDEIAAIKLASPTMAFPKGNEDVIGKSAVVTCNFTAGPLDEYYVDTLIGDRVFFQSSVCLSSTTSTDGDKVSPEPVAIVLIEGKRGKRIGYMPMFCVADRSTITESMQNPIGKRKSVTITEEKAETVECEFQKETGKQTLPKEEVAAKLAEMLAEAVVNESGAASSSTSVSTPNVSSVPCVPSVPTPHSSVSTPAPVHSEKAALVRVVYTNAAMCQ